MVVHTPATSSISVQRGAAIELDGLPLRHGDSGAPVADLHQRLNEAGHPADCADPAVFCDRTDLAIRAFQESRGLEVDGICGRQTWMALAEARHRLGDRLLYLQRPMLRGDDVADLQRRLGSLGFDAGRVDGIFGPDTQQALIGFQRNIALNPDGICGPESIKALARLGGRGDQVSVAAVRERERLAGASSSVSDARIVVGGFGGIDGVVATITRSLSQAGATVSTIRHPDGSHHARVTNEMDATLYVGLHLLDEPGCTISYFETEGWVSYGGRFFAKLLADGLLTHCEVTAEARGRRLPVLRETRMPAVLLRIGPPARANEQGPALADAIRDAVGVWLADPTAGDET